MLVPIVIYMTTYGHMYTKKWESNIKLILFNLTDSKNIACYT